MASEDGLCTSWVGWDSLWSRDSGLGRNGVPPMVTPPHPEEPQGLVLKSAGCGPQSQANMPATGEHPGLSPS